jgi:hypothetical protein
MAESERRDKNWTKQATEKLFAALNRADEIGGELRDYLQDKVATDPRYVSARKTMAKWLGRNAWLGRHAERFGHYESRDEVSQKAQAKADQAAAVAAVTPTATTEAGSKTKGFGDPAIKAQIYGKRSCPWTGRAITLLERHKVDFDLVDLEEPEHEAKAVQLTLETKQHTVP